MRLIRFMLPLVLAASASLAVAADAPKKAITHRLIDGDPGPGLVHGRKAGAHDFRTHPTLQKSVALGQSIFCGQRQGTGPSFEFDLPTNDQGAPTIRTVEVTVELFYEIQNRDSKLTLT